MPDPRLDSPSSGVNVGALKNIGTPAGLAPDTPQRNTRYPMDVHISVVGTIGDTRARVDTEVGRHV